MKTSKKILAAVLAISMVAGVMLTGTVVFADDAVATSKPITHWSFEQQDAGTTLTSGSWDFKYAENDAQIGGNLFFKSAFAGTGALEVKGSTKEDAETNNYLETTSAGFGFNHRKTNTNFNDYGYADLPVLHTSYDIMIPSDTPYKENTRTMYLVAGTTGAAGKYDSNVINLYVNITDGLVDAYASSAKANYDGRYVYEYGDWMTIDAYIWATGEKAMDVAVFVGDELVYWGTRTTSGAITGMATNDWNFIRYNKKDNSGYVKAGTTDYDTTTVSSVTNYDNLYMELLPASAVANVENAARSSYLDILTPKMTTLATATAKYEGTNWKDEDGVRTIFAKKSETILTSTGIAGSVGLVQSSNTTADSKYSIVKEYADTYRRDYLTTETAGERLFALINSRKVMNDAVATGKNTLIWNVDMFIPAGSEAIEKKPYLGFGLDLDASGSSTPTASNYNPLRRITSDLDVSVNIKDNILKFASNADSFGKNIVGAEKSETTTVPSNEWFTFTYVMEFDHQEDQYYVKVYGIYDNQVLYVNEHTIAFTDFNGDGKSDDIYLNQMALDHVAAKNSPVYQTYYDDMSLYRDNRFNWKGIDTDAWTVADTSLKQDAEGNVVVSAKSAKNKKFTEGVLLIAICDADGLVSEILTSTEITNISAEKNAFNYTVPAAKLANAKFVKAFVLDGVSSAKPLSVKGAVELK